jgi:hypothetical protein
MEIGKATFDHIDRQGRNPLPRFSETMKPSLSRTGTRASLSKVNRDSNFSVPGRMNRVRWSAIGWEVVVLGSSTHALNLFEERRRKILAAAERRFYRWGIRQRLASTDIPNGTRKSFLRVGPAFTTPSVVLFHSTRHDDINNGRRSQRRR